MQRKTLLIFLAIALLGSSLAYAQTGSVDRRNLYSYTSTGTTYAYLTVPCGTGSTSPQPPLCVPQTNGTAVYVTDAMVAGGVCSGGGHGALATLINGQWMCIIGASSGAGPFSPSMVTAAVAGQAIVPSSVTSNVNAQANVMMSGASQSGTTATATVHSGSTAIALSSAGDFINGQHVRLPFVGPATTMTTTAPSAPTCPSDKWTQGVPASDGTGSTSYTYEFEWKDGSGASSAVSAACTVSNAVATLSYDHFNLVTPPSAPTGAKALRILGCEGSSCTPGCWAVIPIVSGKTTVWEDEGNHFCHDADEGTSALSAAITNDDLDTTIVSGGGTTSIVVAATPSASATVTMRHDDEPSALAAINAVCSATLGGGGATLAPRGVYHLGQTLHVSQCAGTVFNGQGSGTNSTNGTAFEWDGPVGGTAVLWDQMADTIASDFYVGHGANTPAIDLLLDQIGTVTNNTNNVTFRNMNLGEAGINAQVSGVATNNVSEIKFQNSYFFDNAWVGILIGNNANAKNIRCDDCGWAGVDNYDAYLVSGAFNATDTNFGANEAIHIVSPNDAMTFLHDYFAFSPRILNYPTSSQHESNVSIVNSNTYNADFVTADGNCGIFYAQRGTLRLIGNDFSAGGYGANGSQQVCTASSLSGADVLTSVANTYDNLAPFTMYGSGTYSNSYTSLDDMAQTSSGVLPMGNISATSGDYTLGLGNLSASTLQLEGNLHSTYFNLTQNATITLPTDGYQFEHIGVWVCQNGSSAKTLAWSGVSSYNATPPTTMTTTLSACQSFRFENLLGGSTGWMYEGS